MAKIIDEFKEFAFKGNVVDMAVGVIIGGAFGKIVSSVVGDLLMPLIASIGGVNVSDLKLELKPGVEATLNEAGEVVTEAVAPVTWNYGAFCQNVLDFFIIAICLFFMIKGIAKLSSLKKKVLSRSHNIFIVSCYQSWKGIGAKENFRETLFLIPPERNFNVKGSNGSLHFEPFKLRKRIGK